MGGLAPPLPVRVCPLVKTPSRWPTYRDSELLLTTIWLTVLSLTGVSVSNPHQQLLLVSLTERNLLVSEDHKGIGPAVNLLRCLRRACCAGRCTPVSRPCAPIMMGSSPPHRGPSGSREDETMVGRTPTLFSMRPNSWTRRGDDGARRSAPSAASGKRTSISSPHKHPRFGCKHDQRQCEQRNQGRAAPEARSISITMLHQDGDGG